MASAVGTRVGDKRIESLYLELLGIRISIQKMNHDVLIRRERVIHGDPRLSRELFSVFSENKIRMSQTSGRLFRWRDAVGSQKTGNKSFGEPLITIKSL